MTCCGTSRGAPAHRASKELLAELFWPDTPLDRALPCLQSAVHQLKRAMARAEPELAANPALVFADDQYGLSPRLALRSDLDDRRLGRAEAGAGIVIRKGRHNGREGKQGREQQGAHEAISPRDGVLPAGPSTARPAVPLELPQHKDARSPPPEQTLSGR